VVACLAKDPAARPTAARIAADLRGGMPVPAAAPPAASLPPTTALPPTTVQPPDLAPAPRRRVWALIAGGAAVAVVVVVVAVLAWQAARSAPPPTPSASPTAAPTPAADSAEVRYVDRVCAAGALMTSLGDTATAPPATSDPVQARRDYLASTDRTIATVDAALSDLTVLRDDAPNAAVRTQFGMVVDQFTKARSAFAAGRDTVRASDPLTITAYRAGVDRFADGAGALALAAQLIPQIKLPPEYTAASPAAPRCRS
jgi:hypothetical protein